MDYTYMDCLAQLGVGGAHPGGLFLTKKLLVDEKIQKSTSILDAGCGTGRTSAYISEQYGCHVAAIDNHQMMVKKAKQRFTSKNLSVELVHGSVEEIPYKQKSFDVILSESVMAFVDLSLTLPEFKRVLKQDGVLLAVEMVLEKDLPEDELQRIIDFYGFSQLLTVDEWEVEFERIGFQNRDIMTFASHFNDGDLDHAPDFLLSENMDEVYFDILKEHEQLTEKYEDVLGYRIFRCTI